MIIKKQVLKYGIIIFSLISVFNACSKDPAVSRVPAPPPSEGQVVSDVVYGSNTTWVDTMQNLTMDIYMPTHIDAGKKYPLVVNVHGGGYVSGDKLSTASKCQIYADSGFVAVSINYRVGWNAGGASDCTGDTSSALEAMYRAMQDINAAIRFLVHNADFYSIDPDWIFLSGASAGGVVVQTSSYETDNYVQQVYPELVSKLGNLQNADNDLTNTYSIKGICSIAGGLLDSNLINSSRAYPTIFFQGGSDEVIPVDHGTYLNCSNYFQLYGSLCLYRRLVANGESAVAHILPGAGHGNNGDSGYSDQFMIGNSACFFHQIMRGESQQTILIGTINSCL